MLYFKSVCWIWLAQPTPKQQLYSLYPSDTSPLISQKLALQGSPVWDSCGSSPHSVAGQPALVCRTKHTRSDGSAVNLPALLDAHPHPRIAVNVEGAASLLYPCPPVSSCRLASLLLISDAVQLVSPCPAKLQPAHSSPLPQLHWLCGFTIITWTIYRWITSLPILHHA